MDRPERRTSYSATPWQCPSYVRRFGESIKFVKFGQVVSRRDIFDTNWHIRSPAGSRRITRQTLVLFGHERADRDTYFETERDGFGSRIEPKGASIVSFVILLDAY